MSQNDTLAWNRENELLLKQMDKWRDNYNCKKNCEEWKRWKFCEHLRKDRAKRFDKEISSQIIKLISIKQSD